MSDEKKQDAVMTAVTDGKAANDWDKGVFDCFDDTRNCLCGTFCCWCLLCENAKRLEENQCLYCVLMCCVPVLPMCMLRGVARKKYNIEGDSGNDCLCACCCGGCINCQMANELDHQGVDR